MKRARSKFTYTDYDFHMISLKRFDQEALTKHDEWPYRPNLTYKEVFPNAKPSQCLTPDILQYVLQVTEPCLVWNHPSYRALKVVAKQAFGNKFRKPSLDLNLDPDHPNNLAWAHYKIVKDRMSHPMISWHKFEARWYPDTEDLKPVCKKKKKLF